jgi:hypothetical protein
VNRLGSRKPKVFRYLNVSMEQVIRPHLVREFVRCGKQCRCAAGRRHGPYVYLRYELWDDRGTSRRLIREYVPAREVPRVRRWLRRNPWRRPQRPREIDAARRSRLSPRQRLANLMSHYGARAR